MDDLKTSLAITNQKEHPIIFSLEPWAVQCELPPGATIKVVLLAPILETVQVFFGEKMVTVEWVGSTAEVWRDGQQLF